MRFLQLRLIDSQELGEHGLGAILTHDRDLSGHEAMYSVCTHGVVKGAIQPSHTERAKRSRAFCRALTAASSRRATFVPRLASVDS